jgi:hypothetical protein
VLWLVEPSSLLGGFFLCVVCVSFLRTFTVYTEYKQALASGLTNVRFESLKDVRFVGNPVTRDSGLTCVDSQSGDY